MHIYCKNKWLWFMNCDTLSYTCTSMNMICYNDDTSQVGKYNALKIIHVLFMVSWNHFKKINLNKSNSK